MEGLENKVKIPYLPSTPLDTSSAVSWELLKQIRVRSDQDVGVGGEREMHKTKLTWGMKDIYECICTYTAVLQMSLGALSLLT